MELQNQNNQIAKKTLTASLIQCFNENKILEIAEFSSSVTIEEAKKGTALSVLKAQDAKEAYKAIGSALRWLQSSLNVKEPMSDMQIVDASVTIAQTYYWLRFEEIVLILNRIKTGKTGKLYHMFDVQVFCEIIENYLKSEELAIYHEKEAKKFKDEERKGTEQNEAVRQVFEKLYEKFQEDAAQLSIEDKEERDETGKIILIRHADYYNQLKSLLPEMTPEQKKELRSSYVKINYKDGLQLIDQSLSEEI